MAEISEQQRENVGKSIAVSVHPKISHTIAMAGLAKHYFGGGLPMFIGGALGYIIGTNAHFDEETKHLFASAYSYEIAGVGYVEIDETETRELYEKMKNT